jgi:hypothetical protein
MCAYAAFLMHPWLLRFVRCRYQFRALGQSAERAVHLALVGVDHIAWDMYSAAFVGCAGQGCPLSLWDAEMCSYAGVGWRVDWTVICVEVYRMCMCYLYLPT